MVMNRRWRWKSPPSFFGLLPEHRPLIHEQVFQLIYFGKGGFTFDEVYNMPIYLRKFYFKRLEKEYITEAEEIKKQQKKVNRPFKK
jgi:hypothetical protein